VRFVNPVYVPVIRALGTVPVFRLLAFIFPIKEGAVTLPPNLVAPSEALISATTDGVVDEFVPLSNVQP